MEGLSPVSDWLSQDGIKDLSTKSDETGDNGHTGDKLNISTEEGKDIDHTKETPSSNMDELIGYKVPFYYCKEHPKFENIHKEEVIDHLHHHKEIYN